jgi:hypothetical protein
MLELKEEEEFELYKNYGSCHLFMNKFCISSTLFAIIQYTVLRGSEQCDDA